MNNNNNDNNDVNNTNNDRDNGNSKNKNKLKIKTSVIRLNRIIRLIIKIIGIGRRNTQTYTQQL